MAIRVAEVVGGSARKIYSFESLANAEEFFAAAGIAAIAVEAPDWVQIGTAYDGTAFAQPPPAPEPEPMPAPTPPTLEQVRSQLDALREQTTAEYVAQWGDLSRRELWPLLDAEMARAVGAWD